MRWESWLLRLGLAALAAFQLASGNTAGALVALEGLVVSLVPRLVGRLSHTPVPRLVELLFVLGMALQFASESLKLFEVFTYWDKIVHPTLVALTAWITAWLLLGYRDAFRKHLPVHVVAAIALLLGIAVGATWEYVEFLSDWFGDANLQKSNADTVTDLIANDIGAFVATVLSLRLFSRWLALSERHDMGQLARWLSGGPTRLLERRGRLVGALVALGVCSVIVAAVSIDRDWPALSDRAQPGASLAWNGIDQPGPPGAVLAGDWLPDPQRGTCRVNLEHPKPGSEKMGLLELAAGSVYGLNGQPFTIQARVFESRPVQSEGTQMDGGLAFGIRDGGDFYLLEQSALHDVLRLNRYVHNRRRDVREELVRTHGNEWHVLEVRVRGSQVVAGIDGQEVFSVMSVPENAGGIGLWARTAAETCFADVMVAAEGPSAALPRPAI